MKNTSEASIMPVRNAVARHPNDIKYVAIYKTSDGETMVLARAHDRLSVFQWRAILGTGVQEIIPIEDLNDSIDHAKKQEGFEEFGSMSRKPTKNGPRIIKTHVPASQEEVVHVELMGSPSPEPAPKKQKVMDPSVEVPKQQAEVLAPPPPAKKQKVIDPSVEVPKKQTEAPLPSQPPAKKQKAIRKNKTPKVTESAKQNPYLIAHLAFVKAGEELRRRKWTPRRPLVDPMMEVIDNKHKSASMTVDAIMNQGLTTARAAYVKYLQDYNTLRLAPHAGVKREFEHLIKYSQATN